MSVATLAATMETYSEMGKTEDLDVAQEREIVLRCQNGDADAMGTLIIQYQHWVYNIAYGILGHHQDAQDVAQDAFFSFCMGKHRQIPIPLPILYVALSYR